MSRFLSPSNPIPSSGPYTEILLRSLIRSPTGRSTRLFFSYSCTNSHSLAIVLKHISCNFVLLPSPASSKPGRCPISFGYTRSCPRRLSPAGAWSEPSSQLRGGAGPGGMRRPEASKRGRVRARGLGGADSGWASRWRRPSRNSSSVASTRRRSNWRRRPCWSTRATSPHSSRSIQAR